MQPTCRQAQSFGDAEQALVARPQRGTGRQPDGRKQVRIDIPNSQAKQLVLTDEVQYFPIRCDAGLGQVLQGRENKVALPHITQGKFADYERMRENAARVEQAGKRPVARSQMVDPH
jgi:hypothetical protein